MTQPNFIDVLERTAGQSPVQSGIAEISDQLTLVQRLFRPIFEAVWKPLTTPEELYQFGALVITGVIAAGIAFVARRVARRYPKIAPLATAMRPVRILWVVLIPFLWAAGVVLGIFLLGHQGYATPFLSLASVLLWAWFGLALLTGAMTDRTVARIIIVALWLVAALAMLHLLDPVTRLLDEAGFVFGKKKISLYFVLKAILVIAAFTWLAAKLATVLQRRMLTSTRLPPSIQVLTAQMVRFGFVVLALVMALNVIGIDLTTLAVFSGAVGVGIGFGLQTVFSNFVSGVIILMERSLKVGDFIEIDATLAGEVKEINMRSTVIRTNDNIDVLVPNSQFINGRVTSWTFGDAHRRIHLPFTIKYGTDRNLVRQAGLEAAASVPHTLTGYRGREAQVWLVGFGENALNFELVVWLTPQAVKRPAVVRADYYWALAAALEKHDLKIPFPQRDIHIITQAKPESV